jgi:hypothetical protein
MDIKLSASGFDSFLRGCCSASFAQPSVVKARLAIA